MVEHDLQEVDRSSAEVGHIQQEVLEAVFVINLEKRSPFHGFEVFKSLFQGQFKQLSRQQTLLFLSNLTYKQIDG